MISVGMQKFQTFFWPRHTTCHRKATFSCYGSFFSSSQFSSFRGKFLLFFLIKALFFRADFLRGSLMHVIYTVLKFESQMEGRISGGGVVVETLGATF